MLDKDRACLRITRRTQPSPRGGKSAPLALSAALLVVLAHASPCAAAGLRNAGAPGSEAASLLGGTNLTTSHGVHGGQPGVTAGRDDAATTRMGQLSDAPARRASKALPPPAFDVISAVAHRARAGRRLQTLATSVAGGGFHSLVVLSDGTLRAFGINAFGQLGYGTTSDVGDKQATLPIDQGAVPLGGLAVAVAAGYHHSVVLLVDGSVRAFGFGLIGRLGYGSAANVGDTPDTLPSVQGGVHLGGEAVAVAAGYAHTLVATASGKAFAFGGGAYGMLGYGTNSDVGGKPETLPYSVGPVPLDGNAVAVAAGQYHSLVLLDDGSLWAFGSGEDGKLGYGNSFDVGGTPETLPSEKGPVQLGGKAVAVAAGRSHSLVLLENGTVCAFGQGSQGRLGNGATAKVGNKLATLPSTQAPLSLGGKAVAVAAGEEHSVVLLEDGTVRAFGSGQNGRLGYGDTSNVGDKPETLPSEQGAVSLGGKAVAVAAGNAHSVVMLEDGTARTFGNGMYGKLGYGETSHVGDTPETQPSEKGPVPLRVSVGHSLADADGLVVSHSLANTNGLVVGHSLADADGLVVGHSLANTNGLVVGHSLANTNGLVVGHSLANTNGIVVGHCFRDVHRQPLRFAHRLR
ncbi:HERC1, partial [Symbiodinium sp. KB8]